MVPLLDKQINSAKVMILQLYLIDTAIFQYKVYLDKHLIILHTKIWLLLRFVQETQLDGLLYIVTKTLLELKSKLNQARWSIHSKDKQLMTLESRLIGSH